MVGWHHRLNGHEFEQTLRVKDREACCSPRGLKESDMTEPLNNPNNRDETNFSTHPSCGKPIQKKTRDRLEIGLVFPYLI